LFRQIISADVEGCVDFASLDFGIDNVVGADAGLCGVVLVAESSRFWPLFFFLAIATVASMERREMPCNICKD
jgi:hypothetical protein